jgi:hypothetical protein
MTCYKPHVARAAIRQAHELERLFPAPKLLTEVEAALAAALLDERLERARQSFEKDAEPACSRQR